MYSTTNIQDYVDVSTIKTSKTIEVENTSKQDLYDRVNIWQLKTGEYSRI